MRIANLTALVLLICDQVSKYVVVHVMQLDRVRAIDVFPPWLNFRMAWNQGINFGMFSTGHDVMRWLLVAIAVVVSVLVWLWVRRESYRTVVQISAGLLIGGAVGNAIDRVVYGAVADFLNMATPWFSNPFSFNIADIAIFAGAVGLILFTGRDKTP